jgi:hypothetical protein
MRGMDWLQKIGGPGGARVATSLALQGLVARVSYTPSTFQLGRLAWESSCQDHLWKLFRSVNAAPGHAQSRGQLEDEVQGVLAQADASRGVDAESDAT